jgi:4,5-dihydroxyphthalate decarboxylase
MIEEEKKIIGEDWYPYGIEQNRPTIEALLQYTHEHGLTDRRVKLEELFAPATMRDIPLSEGPARLERAPWPTISGAEPSQATARRRA